MSGTCIISHTDRYVSVCTHNTLHVVVRIRSVVDRIGMTLLHRNHEGALQVSCAISCNRITP